MPSEFQYVAPMAKFSGFFAEVLSIYFPNFGDYIASGDLGIAWADTSDHSVLLNSISSFKGGGDYTAMNFVTYQQQTDTVADLELNFYAVDSIGADLGQIGLIVIPDPQLTLAQFTITAIQVDLLDPFLDSACGIRGDLVIDSSFGGSILVNIPEAMLFFGIPVNP